MEPRQIFRHNFYRKECLRRLNLSKKQRDRSRRQQSRSKLQDCSVYGVSYTRCLMTESYLTSASLIDSRSYLLMPLPEGEKVLLVSSSLQTAVYSYSGSYLGVFSELLPCTTLPQPHCVLECISAGGVFYVKDGLLWEGTDLTGLCAVDRLSFLHEHVKGLVMLPVYDCTLSAFKRVCYGSCPPTVVFYHKESTYVQGLNPQVLLYSQPITSNSVLLRYKDGNLQTIEGKVFCSFANGALEGAGLTLGDIVKCEVKALNSDLTGKSVELQGKVSAVHCYSNSQVLFQVGRCRPSAAEIEEALASGRESHNVEPPTCYNSSTASSEFRMKPEYTEETESFLVT